MPSEYVGPGRHVHAGDGNCDCYYFDKCDRCGYAVPRSGWARIETGAGLMLLCNICYKAHCTAIANA